MVQLTMKMKIFLKDFQKMTIYIEQDKKLQESRKVEKKQFWKS